MRRLALPPAPAPHVRLPSRPKVPGGGFREVDAPKRPDGLLAREQASELRPGDVVVKHTSGKHYLSHPYDASLAVGYDEMDTHTRLPYYRDTFVLALGILSTGNDLVVGVALRMGETEPARVETMGRYSIASETLLPLDMCETILPRPDIQIPFSSLFVSGPDGTRVLARRPPEECVMYSYHPRYMFDATREPVFVHVEWRHHQPGEVYPGSRIVHEVLLGTPSLPLPSASASLWERAW
jgi:hypothetical protein